MTETTQDPRSIAREAAIDAAQDAQLVGDFVEAVEVDGDVTDFRFVALNRGYEGWQWSVALYHDAELDRWTVNEATMIPTDAALRPPAWVPWKDRLTAADLSVTDSIGTDPDDERLEDGFRKTKPVEDSEIASDSDTVSGGEPGESSEPGESGESDESVESVTAQSDADEIVEEFDLSRRHVLSLLGRSQTAKRWYEGPRGPKSLSTKTADGKVCSTCGFFIPLKGDLNVLFGVCANKWSPDDGRVVSIDHGCGEHSEIEPPQTAHLWVQSEPAFDDLHIDVVAQAPREERSEVELMEQLADTDDIEPAADDAQNAANGTESHAAADTTTTDNADKAVADTDARAEETSAVESQEPAQTTVVENTAVENTAVTDVADAQQEPQQESASSDNADTAEVIAEVAAETDAPQETTSPAQTSKEA
ncbi:MAG: DUF3027 domain-containing protein [Bifidobacterium tibiigranuli]|jgi:hypothetical protein|uniref:DUF3027 domain-containing protein n=1 Tax=Bifidobacterium tibiigranuli TaxID=2172043 RepID=UPI0026EE4A4F|nr:DUF3027 domain-containing protein [Bifidobacterium tibiigranuli]MCI1673361.1 DUF3027 domain-containing protein [Bifidobacterium tibiigranuli]MCI1712527.1 DUF3027 domain-containing protein [Bifidobacterium tibiigranuli]